MTELTVPHFTAVCLESPLRADTLEGAARNVRYAEVCLMDCLGRREAPFAGHLLYPRVLDDRDASERSWGIAAHLMWLRRAEKVVVYTDLGITEGMQAAISMATRIEIPVEMRELGAAWEEYWSLRHATPGFHSQR